MARVRLVGRPFALSVMTTISAATTATDVAIFAPGPWNVASRLTNASATRLVTRGTNAISTTRVRMPTAGRIVASLSPVASRAPPSFIPVANANRHAIAISTADSKGGHPIPFGSSLLGKALHLRSSLTTQDRVDQRGRPNGDVESAGERYSAQVSRKPPHDPLSTRVKS